MKKLFLSSLLLFPLIGLTDEEPSKVLAIMPEVKGQLTENHGLTPIKFMPGLYVGELSEQQQDELEELNPALQINAMPDSKEELNYSAASVMLTTPESSPFPLSNWWDAGFTGKSAVIGLLDSGVPDNYYIDDQVFLRQSGLEHKFMRVNRGPNSGFNKYLNGVRTAHGAGVACIYASEHEQYRGLAFGAQNLLVALAGDSEVDDTDWELTLYNLDWMLTTPGQPLPHVINYSFGNGLLNTDWSIVAQTVDFIVNQYKIVWVKSAGNGGWNPQRYTLTIPADSYNAIVVANMNTTLEKSPNLLIKTSDRNKHYIMASSSRGPAFDGRRKPDLTAPGNDTRTCAPSMSVYAVVDNPTFKPYTVSMQYDPATETRLVGGTSMATPHVGASAAVVFDSGITEPMAIKALLINSADTWTDNNQPGPNDKNYPCSGKSETCGHGPIEGSQWNRTYGWGYLNMDRAYSQRNNLILDRIKPSTELCYAGSLTEVDKVTLVWERRVGQSVTGEFWRLTPLTLSLYEVESKQLIAHDDSLIDNVLQLSPYPYDLQKALIKISVHPDFKMIEGAESEPFALASGQKLEPVPCF